MDLVDKEQRALPGFAAQPRRIEHFLQVGDAGKDRRNLLEIKFGRMRKEPRHRGLAGAGRAPENQRAERARLQHARKRAVGAEQMVLADDVGKRVRTQLVGERPRRVAVETAGGEQGWRLLFGRELISAKHHGNLLAAAHNGDAPLMAAGRDDAFEIGGLVDLLTVDRHDNVALAEADRLRLRAVGDVGDDDALGLRIEPQFVGQSRRQIGDRGAEERRMRLDLDFLARRIGQARERDRHDQGVALPDQADLRGAAERLGGEAIVEGVRIVDFGAVDADNDVAGLDAGMRGGAAGNDACDQRAARARQPEAVGDVGGDLLKLGAEPRPLAPRRCRPRRRRPPRAPYSRGWRSRCPAIRPSANRSPN